MNITSQQKSLVGVIQAEHRFLIIVLMLEAKDRSMLALVVCCIVELMLCARIAFSFALASQGV